MPAIFFRSRIAWHNLLYVTRPRGLRLSSSSSRPVSRVNPTTNRPTDMRGGQNLSERHTRLAKMVRGKGHFQNEIQEFSSPSAMLQQQEGGNVDMGIGGSVMNTFRGLRVPDQPRPPESDGACIRRVFFKSVTHSFLRMLHVRLCRLCV